jgi:hypothetical protein
VNQSILKHCIPVVKNLAALALATPLICLPALAQKQAPQFTTGNLVVALEGCGQLSGFCVGVPHGSGTGSANSSQGGYGDNQASLLTLFQYAPVGTSGAVFVNSLTLPQTASGSNFPVSAEYGSSSEATLQLSGSGQYLTIMGYGVNADTFNANPALFGAVGTIALGQSGSLTGQSYTAVPRVVALVDANGNVNSSTALFNIFNTNNPRSIFTANGTTAYVSGQGSGSDTTGGVFFTSLGAVNNTPTPITGLDATNNTVAQDTRDVQIVNNTLYVSVDTKGGSNAARSYIGTLGTAGNLPTTTFGPPVMLNNFGTTAQNGKVTITAAPNSNGNGPNAGLQINVSPSGYFFASPSILYVADTGNGKQTSANSSLGDGGLQKWINTAADGSGTWNLAYTLYQGLNLVSNKSASGTTGLYALTGTVSGGSVLLYATDSTIGDLDPSHLVGITDTLSFTTPAQAASESFTILATAPTDSNFKGVSFAPTVAAPITPTITWPAPAALAFGSALSSSELDATTGIPGTFTYSPAAGTVLPAGPNQTLSVTFTPTDAVTYTTASASTTITINPAAPATPANLIVTRLVTRSGNNIIVQLTLANTGGAPATNVTLTAVKVGATTATPLPLSIGTIPAGATASTIVTVPGTAGAPGAASSITVSGTFAGATFGSSARITLP